MPTAFMRRAMPRLRHAIELPIRRFSAIVFYADRLFAAVICRHDIPAAADVVARHVIFAFDILLFSLMAAAQFFVTGC